jgi:hypothetical protein|tara:strand:- start:110 stop:664 length:555 start_codon:yes stop_codon:yes gene_type:complete
MNISPQLPSSPLATAVNPPTEALRRDNNQREVIIKPEAAAQSAAEKGVASEKERARTSAQNNEQIDFASIRKRAEQANTTISGDREQGSESKEQQQTDKDKSATSDVINFKANNVFSQDGQAKPTTTESSEFDRLINQTLAAQEVLSPTRSQDVVERATRIEHFYDNINQAYTKRPSYQFELTV